MIMSGQVSSVADSTPAAQIETCTLNLVEASTIIHCTRYINGEFIHDAVRAQGSHLPPITNIVKGSILFLTLADNESETADAYDLSDSLSVIFRDEGGHPVLVITGDATMSSYCFTRGTRIATGLCSTKAVEDITYADTLLVWDFDNACLTYAKPCWIKKSEATTYYYKCVFSDGTDLKVVGSDGKSHRLFNCDKQEFISATDCVGQMVMGLNGPVKMLSCDRVDELVEFYNVVTSKHMNLYANGMLASCRLNNLYPIQNMQYVKDDRAVVRKGAYGLVAQKYYDDLRLGERLPGDVDWINQYVERMDQRRV